MTIEPLTLVTIVGMALVTYLTRVGGVLFLGSTASPRIIVWLRHLPGSILVALITPLVLEGGASTLIAAAMTVIVATRTSHLLLAMVAGVGTVWLLRQF